MSNYIITIARQYGSNGRNVGRRLADVLGYEFLDKEIIAHIAENYDVDPGMLDKYDEQSPSKLAGMFSPSITLTNAYIPMYNNILFNDEVIRLQAKALREKAEKNDIVVVGRCGDYIFRNEPKLLRIFIYADDEVRLRKIVNEYHVPADEAKSVMRKADKNRANYYSTYADGKWGDPKQYDLCINSSNLDIDEIVNIIVEYKKAIDAKR